MYILFRGSCKHVYSGVPVSIWILFRGSCKHVCKEDGLFSEGCCENTFCQEQNTNRMFIKTFNLGSSLRHKLISSNPYIFATWWYNSLTFLTYICWSNRNPWSLKCLRSTTLGYKDIGIGKLEFVKRLNSFKRKMENRF